MVKRKIKKIRNVIAGALIFILLINLAFQISNFFGIIFVVGFIYEFFSGELAKRPFLAVALFTGGIITRVAINYFLSPVLEAQTSIDFAVALSLFLLILIIGYKIKKGRLKIRKKDSLILKK